MNDEKKDDNEISQTVNLNSNFTQANVVPILILTGILLVTTIILSSMLLLQINFKADDRYFAVNPDKTLFALPPLDEPNLSSGTLLQWATNAATSVYTLNFNNIKRRIQEVEEFFTQSGYRELLAAYNDSGFIQEVTSKQLIVSAIPRGTPVIKNENIKNGKHYWNVEVPILIQYQSPSDIETTEAVVIMVIQRVSTAESPRGIGIITYSLG